jgi:hypothetical protein
MDQLLAPGAAQPKILSTSALDPGSDTMDRLIAIKGSLADIHHVLQHLLNK